MHILFFAVFLYLVLKSLTYSRPCPDSGHQCCQDAGLHVGSNQLHCQSVTHTHTHTRTDGCNFPSWHKGSMSAFQCDFLPFSPMPAITVPHALSALPLLLVSSHMATPPPIYVIPLDSFSHISFSCWTLNCKRKAQPQDQKTCIYRESQSDTVDLMFIVYPYMYIVYPYNWNCWGNQSAAPK